MEINKCMGCMSDFRGYPCPKCGFDPRKAEGTEYALPLQSILASKYLVGKVLGQGGFGVTYVGWDMTLERKVAIKEYYPAGQVSRNPGTRMLTWYTGANAALPRQEGMELFLKEARKMAKVDRIPNVVRILDMFQENGTAYIVMDFVEGQTLKSLLKNGPMSWEQAKGIFRTAISAMEKVHTAGLVHRDLSPDNLMLTPDGDVMILDLGAAKDVSLGSGAASMQVAKGGFSPFEQYTQRGGSGPWTDVYAMAATIYYTLTGVVPPAAMDRMESDTIRWDYPGLQSLPAPTLEALKKAMAVSVNQRTQSMAELEQGLFGGRQQPVPQPKQDTKPVFVQSGSKKPLPKWLIPAVAAAVVLVAGIGIGIKVTQPSRDYKAAQSLLDGGEYARAAEAFEALGDYEDSAIRAKDAWQLSAYQEAQALMDAEQYAEAAEAFEALGNFSDSFQKAEDAKQLEVYQETYEEAQALMDAGKYFQAFKMFSELDYKDSEQLAQEAKERYWTAPRISLAGDSHTVALRDDGTVVATGVNDEGQCDVSGWQDIVSVSAGWFHTVGLRSDGTVVATGVNTYGRCDVSDWTDIVAVAAGAWHTIGLRSDGTVVAVGSNSDGETDVGGWRDIVAVAADGHTVGLRSDGTVVAQGSGWNEQGQCDVDDWTDIVAVAVGYGHTVGLRSDGTVVATGSNEYGQCDVEDWTDIVAISAEFGHTVGLRSDGTVVATGRNVDGRCNVSSWSDIVAVATGTANTLGLRSDGTVVAVGANDDGQCNVSSWKNIRTP